MLHVPKSFFWHELGIVYAYNLFKSEIRSYFDALAFLPEHHKHNVLRICFWNLLDASLKSSILPCIKTAHNMYLFYF